MRPVVKGLLWAGAAVVGYQATLSLREHWERWHYYRLSRAYCDTVGKPLLRVGMKRAPIEPPNGDVTIDLDPAVTAIPGGVQGDERDMPFADKQFGVCFNEHTLEHLTDIESVRCAVRESVRVADYAVFLTPSPYTVVNLFHRSHWLRIWIDNDRHQMFVQRNNWKLPITLKIGWGDASMTPLAVMVTTSPPTVIGPAAMETANAAARGAALGLL